MRRERVFFGFLDRFLGGFGAKRAYFGANPHILGISEPFSDNSVPLAVSGRFRANRAIFLIWGGMASKWL